MLGDLCFKVFVLLSHTSCSPTAMILLLPPGCSYTQLSHSTDLPHPQACFWGHLLGLEVSRAGDTVLLVMSLVPHPRDTAETGTLTTGLLGMNKSAPLQLCIQRYQLLKDACIGKRFPLAGGF